MGCVRGVAHVYRCPQNRELQIMKELSHTNIVKLKHCFYTTGNEVSGAHSFGCGAAGF